MLLLGRDEVRELLDLDALIDALGPAMADVSAGRASMPGRIGAMVPEREAFLGAMPAYLPGAGVLASKLVTLFPGNAGTSVATHQAVIAVFDPADGSPIALLDGEEITAVRTGAGSALSTRLLARSDAAVLAVLGTGVQARSHARAVTRVRPIRELRVAGRDRAKAEALAGALKGELPAAIRVVASFEEALRGADIVCATTHAAEPVVRREWLSPGVHVCSVGYNQAGREVDDATVADAIVCVEARAAVLAPPPGGSNDLTEPLRGGLVAEADIVEIGELVAGTRAGRTASEQITLYKSVGVAAQDAVAAGLVLAAARERGVGREIEL
jgi:alanine dehydrogenase